MCVVLSEKQVNAAKNNMIQMYKNKKKCVVRTWEEEWIRDTLGEVDLPGPRRV
jgi:hypothetical protein